MDTLEASFYLSIVSLRITLRDINHNNGVYYANNNKEISINGSNYIFKNGKSIEFVTWFPIKPYARIKKYASRYRWTNKKY